MTARTQRLMGSAGRLPALALALAMLCLAAAPGASWQCPHGGGCPPADIGVPACPSASARPQAASSCCSLPAAPSEASVRASHGPCCVLRAVPAPQAGLADPTPVPVGAVVALPPAALHVGGAPAPAPAANPAAEPVPRDACLRLTAPRAPPTPVSA